VFWIYVVLISFGEWKYDGKNLPTS